MPARVKLCAIAKNEGAYIAEWVFHHLHFGFDAIEIWINGTDDTSAQIVGRIAAKHPQVTCRNADRLFDECLSQGEHFQRRAYKRMARKTRRQGFTHVAFLDLDEYWVPRDGTSGVTAFVPDDPAVKVISFPWCMDVPDPERRAFSPPLAPLVQLQMDRHVKSVVRLDGSVRTFREHSPRLYRGGRLLVRDRFPLVDPKGQRRGSFVTDEFLVQHWEVLPEAFVLHAINRSPVEYVSNLTKGLRQTGFDIAIKPNRYGYLPTDAPTLTFAPPPRALQGYERSRARFRRRTGVDDLVRESEELVVARAEALLGQVERSGELQSQLREALRGITTPSLDAACSGPDTTSATRPW